MQAKQPQWISNMNHLFTPEERTDPHNQARKRNTPTTDHKDSAVVPVGASTSHNDSSFTSLVNLWLTDPRKRKVSLLHFLHSAAHSENTRSTNPCLSFWKHISLDLDQKYVQLLEEIIEIQRICSFLKNYQQSQFQYKPTGSKPDKNIRSEINLSDFWSWMKATFSKNRLTIRPLKGQCPPRQVVAPPFEFTFVFRFLLNLWKLQHSSSFCRKLVRVLAAGCKQRGKYWIYWWCRGFEKRDHGNLFHWSPGWIKW